ncbi:hypothetical protein BJV78DRAFT_1286121 [Lactifluus subvellereus]|nr:hypothetical protein BJV78DRAFT_1286121 [Lactifluus subvellereus]
MSLTIPPSPSSSSQPTMLGYYRLTIPLTLSYLLISLTRAQQDYPPCVIPCAKSAAQAAGCNLTDHVCLCNSPAFAQALPSLKKSAAPPSTQLSRSVLWQRFLQRDSSSI